MRCRKITAILLSIFMPAVLLIGCQRTDTIFSDAEAADMQSADQSEKTVLMEPGKEITELEDGLSMVSFEGNDGFESFLAQGGAPGDRDVIRFLTDHLGDDVLGLLFGNNPFGCSTLAATGENGEVLFGRNFDWNTCDA